MSQLSTALAAAVGQILFEQVNGGDVGQLLGGMDVPLPQQLRVHALVCDAPMRAWLESLGLPKLEEKDCFWSGQVLALITETLERRDRQPS